MGRTVRHSDSGATPADRLAAEREARAAGFLRVAGVDEAGRGPLAGPVVAAAVILPSYPCPVPVNDSKQLTPKQRETLYEALIALPGIRIGLAEVSAAEIDELNILRATHKAMRLALLQLLPEVDYALVDGLPVKELPVPSRAIVKGDALSESIGAASIVAKVVRDRRLEELDRRYPGYGFALHKGYGTEAHLRALAQLGPTPEHRRSFAPVRECLGGRRPPEQLELGL